MKPLIRQWMTFVWQPFKSFLCWQCNKISKSVLVTRPLMICSSWGCTYLLWKRNIIDHLWSGVNLICVHVNWNADIQFWSLFTHQIALICIVIMARKPVKKPDKNVKSPRPEKDRKCEDRNNPNRHNFISFVFNNHRKESSHSNHIDFSGSDRTAAFRRAGGTWSNFYFSTECLKDRRAAAVRPSEISWVAAAAATTAFASV